MWVQPDREDYRPSAMSVVKGGCRDVFPDIFHVPLDECNATKCGSEEKSQVASWPLLVQSIFTKDGQLVPSAGASH